MAIIARESNILGPYKYPGEMERGVTMGHCYKGRGHVTQIDLVFRTLYICGFYLFGRKRFRQFESQGLFRACLWSWDHRLPISTLLLCNVWNIVLK